MTPKENIFYFTYLHRTGLTVSGLSLLLLLWPLVEQNPYNLGLSNLIAIYAMVVLGLNLFIGYTGQISLGHAAFFAIGAYGSAIGTTTFGGPGWAVIAVVAIATATIALAVGVPALKLSGHYLAMATFWFVGARSERLQTPAIMSLVIFMLGLAAGRILSIAIDGMPHPLLATYTLLEIGFGAIGLMLLKKGESAA